MEKFLALSFSLLIAASAYSSPAEDQVRNVIQSQEVTVVHLWAPWCSNCLAELKSEGWVKIAKANPDTKFIFVSVWSGGENGLPLLKRYGLSELPNVAATADPGPRTGDGKIKQFAGLPFSWIPTTWVFKGGDLRYALNYGEVRFDVLQQFLEDSKSEWSHKDEAK